MADKPRTPPPPRSQGPRKRATVQTPGGARRPRSALIAGVLAGGVLVAVVFGIALTRGSSKHSSGGPSPAAKMVAAGCTFKTYPSLGRSHVTSLAAKVKYNSFPPTSGTHYQSPAIWGHYIAPLVLVQEVHNLEHGGMIIQYGSKVPQPTVDQLLAFYTSSQNGMLLAPLPTLGAKVALTAWTHLATCTKYSKAAFTAFRDAYRGKGPESAQLPLSTLKPGT